MNLGDMLRAMKAAGCSLDQVIDAADKWDCERRAKGANRVREHRVRNVTSVTHECNVTSVKPRTAHARVEDNTKPLDSSGEDIGAQASPSQPKEPSVRAILLECLSADTADAVIAHRQSIKHPLKAATARHLAKGFKSTGDPEGAASMMVSRGWRGFEPKWFSKEQPDETRKPTPFEAACDLVERGVGFGPVPPSPIELVRRSDGRSEGGDPARLLPDWRRSEPRDLRGGGFGDLVAIPGGRRVSGD